MTATETAPAPETEPEAFTAMVTETEPVEMSREVDDEEEEKIRRQKKLEEALEAQSLRRIISAYLKYLIFSFFFLLNLVRLLYRFIPEMTLCWRIQGELSGWLEFGSTILDFSVFFRV